MERKDSSSADNVIIQESQDEMHGKYLTFWIDKQLFGIPIAHIVQIVGIQKITEIPDFPSYAKGVINLRGSIIPLIDVRIRIGKMQAEYNERTCIIVTNILERSVGFIVDEVDEVTSITDDLISPPPAINGFANGYISGVGRLNDEIVLLIDTRVILGQDELDILTNRDICV